MIITDNFVWWHLAKTGGTKTQKLIHRTLDTYKLGGIVFEHGSTDHQKHTTYHWQRSLHGKVRRNLNWYSIDEQDPTCCKSHRSSRYRTVYQDHNSNISQLRRLCFVPLVHVHKTPCRAVQRFVPLRWAQQLLPTKAPA